MDNHLEKIGKLLSDRFGVSPDLITNDAKLTSDLNLSPLEISDIISILAQEYNFSLPDDLNLSTIDSVSDLSNLIDQYSEEL